MMLRQRVVVTSLLAAIPATAAIAWTVERVRADERELAVTRFVMSQLNEQVRERCEGDPTWFLTGPLAGRPPGGVFVETNPDEMAPRPRVEPQPFELFAYDGRFAGSSSATPRMSEEMRQALRFQATPVPVSAPHVTESGTGVQVGVATTWTGGPCAYFVGRLDAPPNQRRNQLLAVIGLFAVTMFVALIAAAQTVGRVRRLARDARNATEDDYASIAPDRLRDELSSLTFVINDTSQALHERRSRIDDLNESLRRFVQTTDEEVARPLAALEGTLASASSTQEVTRASVRDALRQAHQLSSQVDNLMVAARLRMLGSSPARTPVDLVEVVTRVANRHQAIASAGGVSLRTALPPDSVTIEADEALVERAVANLVDNAVRYCQSGCLVTVTLQLDRDDRRFRLFVTDNGPGVSEEHFRTLTAIRRFRGDEGKNRRPGTPGLGLAVAREVSDRYGLSLDLKRPAAGGFEAELSGSVTASPTR